MRKKVHHSNKSTIREQQNKKSLKNSAFYGNYHSALMTEQFNVLAAKYNEILDIISNMWLWRICGMGSLRK